MSLELIVGPPNSGRADEVLRRLAAELDSDPLLIVPSGEEVARFERDLCSRGRPVIGATIRTFASFAERIAATMAKPPPPVLTPAERLALMRATASSTSLRVLSRSARSTGFGSALDALIAELQAALVTPAALRAAAAAADGDTALELELADLYEKYQRLRDGAGRSDQAMIAAAAAGALSGDDSLLRARPILIHGFDDLTEAQLELTRKLAARAAVVVSVTYADRPGLSARAGLLTRLRDEGAVIAAELEHNPRYTPVRSLAHLDRSIFAEDPARAPLDDGVRLLDCTGERGEAEAIGLEIAQLLTGNAEPEEIIVALRRPAADGPLIAHVLRSMAIPVTLDADLPLAGTSVGRALLSLSRAGSAAGEPADVLRYLRADTASRPERADWVERRLQRGDDTTLGDLVERWGEGTPAHLRRLLSASPGPAQVRSLALSARRLAEGIHRERAPLAGERSSGTPFDPLEVRAAIAAAELLSELAAVGDLEGCTPPDLDAAAEALAAATVRSWQGSAHGRVRVLSPYRLRGERARFLFVAGMQEGTFPAGGSADPLLSEPARAGLGIPALRRRDQDLEERYLFSVCISRPLERLYLSWRSSDDEGKPTPRSPFIDEVLDLLGADAESAEAKLVRKRDVAQVVPAAEEAPTPRLLARALTLRHGADPSAHRDALAELGADLSLTGEVLGLTTAIPDLGLKPKGLHHPYVAANLKERTLMSATSLEGWVECSYRWFVRHELQPERLEPQPDPLWLGGVVHEALNRLYSEAPGADSIPRPGDVATWKRRFSEILDAIVAEEESGSTGSARALALARARIQVEAFLDEDAATVTDLRPRPDLLEVGFGMDPAGEPEALDLGDFSMRGRIDRIDVAPDGVRAVLRDYKTSKKASGRAALVKEGKLQLPLYMLAMRERLDLDPIAGLYHPLASYGDRSPRGIARREQLGAGGLLDGLGLKTRKGSTADHVDDEDFEGALQDARARAIEAGERMRGGKITRDPLNGECPKYCTFQAICRLERALGVEAETE
ncbi:MAG: PD-(D/E)XK nuclease family protein [Actinomycetota bacterium]|nr:PD-(D/E)XK nuclease family protein [Actinomycetota bacterium]